MRNLKKILLTVAVGTAVVATAAACSSSGSSSSKDTKPIATIKSLNGKSTSVALDSGFVSALTSLKLTPGLSGTATMSGTTVTFPITGGHVTLYKKGQVSPYVVGEIDHQGSGLTLTAGSTVVTLENFVIDPGEHANLTGDVLVNGQSAAKGAKLFNLDGSTLKPITTTDGVTKLTGTRVLLSGTAAGLLDKTFNTTAVKGGTLVGVATILAS
jgi:hypothetical protein